jgi:hypothetical protein
MRVFELGFTNQKSNEPDPRGERVAAFVDDYMRTHPGLTVGELAFRLRADKRDLQRLIRDRSCGWRLEDALAAYFGDLFVEAVFRPVVGDGPSRRERELERERAEIAARRERLERERAEVRKFRPEPAGVLRLLPDQDRGEAV